EAESAVFRSTPLLHGCEKSPALLRLVRQRREAEQVVLHRLSFAGREARNRGRDPVQRRARHETHDYAASRRSSLAHQVASPVRSPAGASPACTTGGGSSRITLRITPPCSCSSDSAASRSTPSFCITIAVFT